jgi:hypothetical protein
MNVGRFRVRGKAGTNRVRFRGRIGRRALRPGTYRILGRTLPSRRHVTIETRLVIFGPRTPTRGEAEAARAENACSVLSSGPIAFDSGRSMKAGTHAGPDAGAGKPKKGSSGGAASRAESGRGEIDRGVLGTRFDTAEDAVRSLHPFLYFLLGMAIALLGIAALPARVAPNYRIAALLEHQRGEIAIAGMMTLLAVAVIYVLGLGRM